MNATWNILQERLTSAFARQRRLERGATVASLLGGAALAFFCMFLLDYLFSFPAWVRLVMTSSLLALFAWWLPRRQRHLLFGRKLSLVEIARQVENCADRTASGFRSVLVSAVEFAQAPDLPGSPALKEWVVTESQQEPFNPQRLRLASPAMLRRGRWLGLTAVAVYALWAVAGSHSLRTFWQRSIGMKNHYLTRTQIISLHAPTIVAQYKTVTVHITAKGVLPAQGRLKVRYQGESTFSTALLPVTGKLGEFEAELREPAKPLTFTAYLGDAESDPLSVKVIKPAFVESGIVVIHAPAYTGVGEREQPFGDIEVPEGSKIDIQITPDRPVASSELELDGVRQKMEKKGAAFVLTGLETKLSARLSIRLVDADGIENEDRLVNILTVRQDMPPELSIVKPTTGTVYATTSRVSWQVVAHDDYGLVSLELHYAIQEDTGSGERKTVREGSAISQAWADNPREKVLSGTLDLAPLQLQAGQTLVLQARAADRCESRETGKEAGLSTEVALRIVSPQEMRMLLEEEMSGLGKMLGDLTEDMRRQKAALDKAVGNESWR